jgi:hypothetical protein
MPRSVIANRPLPNYREPYDEYKKKYKGYRASTKDIFKLKRP